ncbi:hypothetical protein LTR85_001322 [Meristemomyces frigidus]|nr:hypothetical protein LTR85_001322 [Meristemomyces frigidus]
MLSRRERKLIISVTLTAPGSENIDLLAHWMQRCELLRESGAAKCNVTYSINIEDSEHDWHTLDSVHIKAEDNEAWWTLEGSRVMNALLKAQEQQAKKEADVRHAEFKRSREAQRRFVGGGS